MGEIDLYPIFQVNTKIKLTQEGINIPTEVLPRETITGAIQSARTRHERCRVTYGDTLFRGAHGTIQRIERRPSISISPLCVKKPIPREFSLCSEAIVQWLAANALEVAGIQGAVPRVYDLFQYAGETRFTMDYIEGTSSVQAILDSEDPERTFTHILAQTALILGYLQETIHLDHRDLKADNLWIRSTPVHYRVRLGSKVWTLTSPFQVVLLDFGFACLGGPDGNAVINLSDGVLPAIDPCPKEGRDLFQLLVSLWSLPAIRGKMSPTFQALLERLLSYKQSAYDSLVQMTERSQWSYLVVSDAKFKHPPLGCQALLEELLASPQSKGFPSIQLSVE